MTRTSTPTLPPRGVKPSDDVITALREHLSSPKLPILDLVRLQCLLGRDDPRRRRIEDYQRRMLEVGRAIRGIMRDDPLDRRYLAFIAATKDAADLGSSMRSTTI